MGAKKKHQKKHRDREFDEDDQQIQRKPSEQIKSTSKQEEDNQNQTKEQPKFQIIPPKKVSYCPVCSFPFELCQYGKSVNQCIHFLYGLAPTKVIKYHPNFKQQDIQAIKKQMKQNKKQEETKEKQQKKQKTVKEKYIVIDVKNRQKKKFVTNISGLEIFDIDQKEFTKKCSKKFACSCSATEQGVQLQGDFFEQIKQILVMEHKVKKKYILDGEQYKVKFNQQMAKKKAAKKLKDGVIKEQQNQDDPQEKKQGPKIPVIPEKVAKNRLGFQIRDSDQEDDQ